MLLILVTYFGIYVYLTVNGKKIPTQSGKKRYAMGMSATDIIEWMPKGLHWHPYIDVYGKNASRGNGWGYFYSPLISLDRLYWHKTEKISKEKN